MEESGDEKLLAVARHIAKTLGRTDTMTDDILQIFSTFDRRFSKMSEKSNGDDDSTGSLAAVDQTLRSLERRISRFVSADRPIWSDTAGSAAFLDAIDELVAALREWESSAPEAELSELLSRAEGLLQQAMFRLEEEFRELVDSYGNSLESSNSFTSSAPYGSFDPSHSPDSDSEEEGSGIPTARPLPDYDFVIDAMPSGTIADLHEIAKRMVPAGYGKECSRVYASCRGGFLEESLSRLGLEKRSIEEVQKIPWAQVEDDIHRWMKIANVAFRILFPSERRLIDRVLSDLPQSFSDITFMEVCRGSVIRVLNFADAIAVGSRSPERLFRVLDLFETMRDLMPELSSVFSDANCVSIRVEALAVWKRLGESIRAMFVELENLIKRDPAKATVPGGGLHPITRYVMNYLVAGSASCRTLEQALQIANQDGNGGQFELEDTTPTTSSVLSSEISWIIDLLQSNLEAKSKMYRDPALSSIFLMNNNRYIAQKVRNSELRTIVGDDWVRKQKAKVRQHHVSYQRVAWGRILATLRVDGSSIPNAGAAGVRGTARERLKQFNAGLEEACKVQREWVVVEDQIREELRISVAENLIPAYRSFLGRYQHVLEDGKHVDKHLKYSLEDVEAKVNELFLRRK